MIFNINLPEFLRIINFGGKITKIHLKQYL